MASSASKTAGVRMEILPKREASAKRRPNIGVTRGNAMVVTGSFGGLPFCITASILTAIVKPFTSDSTTDTGTQHPAHQAHVRRTPAMRFALLTTVVAVGALACGKQGGDQTQTQAPNAAPAAAPAAPSAATTSGPVIEVKMTGNGSTKAAFEPNSITIPAGATVRFINVAGGPHDIAFWSDSVPSGGAAALQAGMKNTIDNLAGPFLTQPNEAYEVSFANAPKGTYKGFCTPHLTLGMKITIKVQ